jgi:transcriptional adapter 3
MLPMLIMNFFQVIEAYRKVQASKAKKKSPTKKEKEMFYKALKEREAIVKQLHRSESQ